METVGAVISVLLFLVDTAVGAQMVQRYGKMATPVKRVCNVDAFKLSFPAKLNFILLVQTIANYYLLMTNRFELKLI